MRQPSLVAMLLALLIPGSALGADYYVSESVGDDTTGDGSCGSPWRTPAHAISQMTSGDDLFLRCGDTWHEVVSFAVNGVDSNNPSILGAYYQEGADCHCHSCGECMNVYRIGRVVIEDSVFRSDRQKNVCLNICHI